jgi:hypothetical protein
MMTDTTIAIVLVMIFIPAMFGLWLAGVLVLSIGRARRERDADRRV